MSDEQRDELIERAMRGVRGLETHTPHGCDPASDDMTVEFAIKLSEQDAEIATLRAALDRAEAEKAELAKQVYVPGLWSCPKCRFHLVQSNLNASDGSVTARDTPGDKCPNCDSPLWRITERQAGNEMVDRCEVAITESATLRAELAAAKQYGIDCLSAACVTHQSELTAAEAESDRLRAAYNHVRALNARITLNLGAELAAVREALEWYADQNNWKWSNGQGFYASEVHMIMSDQGHKARTVLQSHRRTET